MKYIPKGRSRRAGFTLVEILMVLAIIGILIALIVPALTQSLSRANQTTARTEIAQLETALAAARQGLAPDNPALVLPSSITLREDANYTTATELVSRGYLIQIFGKNAIGNKIDWNGDGSTTGVYTLTGPSALVFWLGGISSGAGTTTPSCLGFSNSVTNPAASGGTRRGPYFQFKTNRLIQDPSNAGFLMYQDPYQVVGTGPTPPSTGQVYAYFTSYKAGNDYQTTDCSSISVLPYSANSSSYINPNGVQIICAGKDGSFGTSSNWSPATGYAPGNVGFDDLANFSSTILGNGMSN